MPTSFPGAIDTLANPTATDFLDLVDHAGQHGNANDAIEAIETKLGTGASTASSGTVLRGTGAGTTAFGQVASGDIAANAITTVKITDANVTTAKIADASITAAKLSTSAIFLDYAQITTSFTTTTVGAYVDVTSLSVTVTVPAGGRRVEIEAYTSRMNASSAGVMTWAIREGSTCLNQSLGATTDTGSKIAKWVGTPTAGSHTYKVSVSQNAAGTITVAAGSTPAPTDVGPAFILVKLI